jgi:hypothetical protein
MPEGLQTTEGTPLEVQAAEAAFAQTMAAAPPTGDLPAPPPDHGKDVPKDRPKRGRPPRASREAAKGAPKSVSAPAKADYTPEAQALVGTVWTVAAALPPTQAYAYVINQNADALAAALAEGAKQSDSLRKWVAGGGNAGWQLQLAAVGINMGMGAMQMMRDPELRAQAAEATRVQLRAMLPQPETSTDEPGDVQQV